MIGQKTAIKQGSVTQSLISNRRNVMAGEQN